MHHTCGALLSALVLSCLVGQMAYHRGKGWEPWGGLGCSYPCLYLQNCQGNEILLSSTQSTHIILICKGAGKKKCGKSLQLRDTRCVPDSYASHLSLCLSIVKAPERWCYSCRPGQLVVSVAHGEVGAGGR